MKLKQLKEDWRKAALNYHQNLASEIAGWYYSRYCIGEAIDKDAVLAELKQSYPEVVGLGLEPFIVSIRVENTGLLKIKYRSTGTRIGYTYTIEPSGGEKDAVTKTFIRHCS